MATTTLTVTGMTCSHCATAVTKALKNVAGVESAEVSLEQHQAVVAGAGSVDVASLIKAIEEAGYRAEPCA